MTTATECLNVVFAIPPDYLACILSLWITALMKALGNSALLNIASNRSAEEVLRAQVALKDLL